MSKVITALLVFAFSFLMYPIFLFRRIWWFGTRGNFDFSSFFTIVTREHRQALHATVLFLLLQVSLLLVLCWQQGWNKAKRSFLRIFRIVFITGTMGWLAVFAVPPFRLFIPVLLPVTALGILYHAILESRTLFSCKSPSVIKCIADFFGSRNIRHAAKVVFLFALLFHSISFFKVAVRQSAEGSRDYLLTGDQPAYMYMAHSLVHDRNLDVATNQLPFSVYSREGGKHAGGVRRHNPRLRPGTPAYEERSAAFGDAIYSTHRPGTSFLIAPFYAIGHLMGDYHRGWVVAFLLVLFAFAARDIFIAAKILTTNDSLALCFSMGATMLVPVVVMSTAVFSETIMFFVMARMIRHAVENDLRWFRNLEISILFSFSPWLQDKYGLWCLPFVVMRVIMLWPNWKAYILPALPFAVSAYFMAQFNLLLYGRILPSTGTLGSFHPFSDAIKVGIPGIWFDWGYGLLMLAPITILLPAGLLAIHRTRKSLKKGALYHYSLIAALFTVLLVGTLITGMWWAWWGAFAPPNRFMLPLVPLVSVAAIVYFSETKNVYALAFWFLSAFMGLEVILRPYLWYSRRNPAVFVSGTFFWDLFAVRFGPFVPYYQNTNMNQLIVVAVGIIVACLFVCKIYKRGIWPRKMKIILWGALIACITFLGFDSVYLSKQLADGDLPFAIGYIRHPSLVRVDNHENDYLLSFDMWLQHVPGNFAMGVHFLSEDQRNVIAQDDFDLNVYLRDIIMPDPELRQVWENEGFFMIRQLLEDVPDNAAYVRFTPYNPAGTQNLRFHIRSNGNVLAIK